MHGSRKQNEAANLFKIRIGPYDREWSEEWDAKPKVHIGDKTESIRLSHDVGGQ